jgi:hypothetical protein
MLKFISKKWGDEMKWNQWSQWNKWSFSTLKKSEKFWHSIYSGFLVVSGFVVLVSFQNCSKGLKVKVNDQASKLDNGDVRPQQLGDCALEDGSILPEFSSRYFYSRSSVNANQSCDSFKSPSPRKCIKGTLNGDASYSLPDCGVSIADVIKTGGRGSCSYGGVTANEGEVGKFYLSDLSTEASPCQSVHVSCVKSDSVYKFAFESGQSYFKDCKQGASCADPSNSKSGITFPNGTKVNFSNTEVSTDEQPCTEKNVKLRQCVDGNWSPTESNDYKYFDITNYSNTFGGCAAKTPQDCEVENVIAATKTNDTVIEVLSTLSIKNSSSSEVYDNVNCLNGSTVTLACINGTVTYKGSSGATIAKPNKIYNKCINPNDLKPLYMGLIDGIGVQDVTANGVNIKQITISGWACQISTSPSAKEQEIRILFNAFKEGGSSGGPQPLFDFIGAIDKNTGANPLNTAFKDADGTEYDNIKRVYDSCYSNGGTEQKPKIRFAKVFYVGPDAPADSTKSSASMGSPNKVLSLTTYKNKFENALILPKVSSMGTLSNNIKTSFGHSFNNTDVYLKPYYTNNSNDRIHFPTVNLSQTGSETGTNTGTGAGTGSGSTTGTSPSYLGFLESTYTLSGKDYIGGWACVEGQVNPVTVSLQVMNGGSRQEIWTVTANKHRPNFTTSGFNNTDPCKSGSELHGFEVEINQQMKDKYPGKEIFAAIYVSPGKYIDIAKTNSVYTKILASKPTGQFDAIGNNRTKNVSGWSYDPYFINSPLTIHFYQCQSESGCPDFTKGFLGLRQANLSIEAEQNTVAFGHRFDGSIGGSWINESMPGKQYICAYALNPRGGTSENILLGCKEALKSCFYYEFGYGAPHLDEYAELGGGGVKTACQSPEYGGVIGTTAYTNCVINHIHKFGISSNFCN